MNILLRLHYISNDIEIGRFEERQAPQTVNILENVHFYFHVIEFFSFSCVKPWKAALCSFTETKNTDTHPHIAQYFFLVAFLGKQNYWD